MEIRTKLGENGRILIPASYRKILDIHSGDEIIMTVGDGEIRLSTPKDALKRAQSRIKKYLKDPENLSQEFIKFRKEDERTDR